MMFFYFWPKTYFKIDGSILANEDICRTGTCCSLASFLSLLPDLSTRNNWFLWWSFWPLIAATFLTFLPWSVTFKFSRYLKSSSFKHHYRDSFQQPFNPKLINKPRLLTQEFKLWSKNTKAKGENKLNIFLKLTLLMI